MAHFWKKHLLAVGFFLGVWGLYAWLDLPCPFLVLTGYPCPTCGCTHALLALLHGNWEAYRTYQPMALPLVFSVILCLHLSRMKGALRKCALAFAILTLFLNMGIYLSRLSG